MLVKSALAKIDSLQKNLRRDISLTIETASLAPNLAPACLRRDIGVLGIGFIPVETQLWTCHRKKKGFGNMQGGTKTLLSFSGIQRRWHPNQLLTHVDNSTGRQNLYRRSTSRLSGRLVNLFLLQQGAASPVPC